MREMETGVNKKHNNNNKYNSNDNNENRNSNRINITPIKMRFDTFDRETQRQRESIQYYNNSIL